MCHFLFYLIEISIGSCHAQKRVESQSDNDDSEPNGIYAIPNGTMGGKMAPVTTNLNHNRQIKFTFDYRRQVMSFHQNQNQNQMYLRVTVHCMPALLHSFTERKSERKKRIVLLAL